jgi:hypothetical protein
MKRTLRCGQEVCAEAAERAARTSEKLAQMARSTARILVMFLPEVPLIRRA